MDDRNEALRFQGEYSLDEAAADFEFSWIATYQADVDKSTAVFTHTFVALLAFAGFGLLCIAAAMWLVGLASFLWGTVAVFGVLPIANGLLYLFKGEARRGTLLDPYKTARFGTLNDHKRLEVYLTPIEYTMDDTGLGWARPWGSSHLSWEVVDRVLESEEHFGLSTPMGVLSVRKDWLESPVGVEIVRARFGGWAGVEIESVEIDLTPPEAPEGMDDPGAASAAASGT